MKFVSLAFNIVFDTVNAIYCNDINSAYIICSIYIIIVYIAYTYSSKEKLDLLELNFELAEESIGFNGDNKVQAKLGNNVYVETRTSCRNFIKIGSI